MTTALTDALQAVLLFYTAPYWGDTERMEWERITGSTEATTVVLCDTIRAVLHDAGVQP